MALKKTTKILLLEDEPALAEILSESLESKGFEVFQAPSIAVARTLMSTNTMDILLADVMLPDGSGFEFARSLRKKNPRIPILFLTSRSRTEDVVEGFESGGNDYLKKPFSVAELIVRINALLDPGRLSNMASPKAEPYKATIGKIIFNYPAGTLGLPNYLQTLSSRETEILHLLYQHKNDIIERKEILLNLWGNDDFFSGRSLDVFISKLRKYMKADPSVIIANIRGRGYRLVC